MGVKVGVMGVEGRTEEGAEVEAVGAKVEVVGAKIEVVGAKVEVVGAKVEEEGGLHPDSVAEILGCFMPRDHDRTGRTEKRNR